MGRASALQSYNLPPGRSSLTLLDSAASVHIFHTKERFSHFRRPLKREGLLCSSGVVPIEGWGEVALPLKVTPNTLTKSENWTTGRILVF